MLDAHIDRFIAKIEAGYRKAERRHEARREGEEDHYEALFRKHRDDSHNADDTGPAGVYRVFGLQPRAYHVLGRRSAVLLVFGLAVCCFAAARDGWTGPYSTQLTEVVRRGCSLLVSVPTVAGCIGAALIIIAAVATPIAKTQRAREIWFYIMSGGAMAKIVTMELASDDRLKPAAP